MEANRPRIELMNSDASRAYEAVDDDIAYIGAYIDEEPPYVPVGDEPPLAEPEVAPPAEAQGHELQRRTRRGSRGRGKAATSQKMNPLQHFEAFFEGLFEGSFTRLFRSKIQPAELAHKLERAMEDGQQVSVGKTFAPNAYQLELNPEDYAQFADFKASLEHELAEYINRVARQRGYRLTTRFPLVTLVENERVGRRDIHASGRIVDPRVDPEAAAALEGEIERTRAMRIPPQYLAAPRPSALVVMSGKQRGASFPVEGAQTMIGRGLDNTVVIDDPRVSRHHAEIRWQGGRYSLFDAGSTNGTFLNDMQITESPLSVGDRVSLGGFELMFQ